MYGLFGYFFHARNFEDQHALERPQTPTDGFNYSHSLPMTSLLGRRGLEFQSAVGFRALKTGNWLPGVEVKHTCTATYAQTGRRKRVDARFYEEAWYLINPVSNTVLPTILDFVPDW